MSPTCRQCHLSSTYVLRSMEGAPTYTPAWILMNACSTYALHCECYVGSGPVPILMIKQLSVAARLSTCARMLQALGSHCTTYVIVMTSFSVEFSPKCKTCMPLDMMRWSCITLCSCCSHACYQPCNCNVDCNRWPCIDRVAALNSMQMHLALS